MTVAVLGNAAVDLLFEVEALPRPGCSVAAAGGRRDLGGKGLNQAIAARRAGAEVRLCAAIGEDPGGEAVTARLRAEGIDPAHLIRRPRPTDRSLIFVTPDGENAVVAVAPPGGAPGPAAVRGFLEGLRPGDLLVIGGDLPIPTLEAALHGGHQHGLRTILNPPPARAAGGGLLRLAGMLVANRREILLHGGGGDLERAVGALREAGVGRLVVTLGAEGALLIEPDGRFALPAPPATAVDTTGAGDLLLGVLAAGLDRGLPSAAALRRAVAAASLSVGRRGTLASFPGEAEMAALFARLEREEAVVASPPRE